MISETQTDTPSAIADRASTLAEIFDRVAGGESIRAVLCKTPSPGFPHVRTFWRWVAAEDEVRKAYELAICARADVFAEEIIEIADAECTEPIFDAEGNPRLDEQGRPLMVTSKSAIEHARLRIEARKWIASRLLPKKYGDRTILAGDADNPLAVDLTDARAQLMSKLLPEQHTAEKPSALLNS
jgi:hypothetical protein